MPVVVIGTGIAGNDAAWTLSKRYPVTVYDREIRPGGHSHTVTIDYDGTPLSVDIGFIVYNEMHCRCPASSGKTVLRFALIENAMRYHFRVSPPGQHVKLRILETDREGPLLAATFNGRRRALTTAALLRSFFALPLLTLKIVAAMHWQALRLWLKGAQRVPRCRICEVSRYRLGDRQTQRL